MVFPRRVDGERYVGEVIELLDESTFRDLDRDERCGVIRKQGTAVHWNTVAWRRPEGGFAFAYDHPDFDEGDREPTPGGGDRQLHTFERVAALTDRSVAAVEDEFHRKHRYVRYFVREGIDGFEGLYDLLADLETDEAATVERLSRQSEDRSTGDASQNQREAGDD